MNEERRFPSLSSTARIEDIDDVLTSDNRAATLSLPS